MAVLITFSGAYVLGLPPERSISSSNLAILELRKGLDGLFGSGFFIELGFWFAIEAHAQSD